jgi:anti-anti-sigma regulatory factor
MGDCRLQNGGVILVTVNKPKQILLLSFIGRVRAEELAIGFQDLAAFLSELSPGFRLLSDLSAVESFDKDCVKELAKAMELCDQKNVSLRVLVIPDPSKDIGLNILASFHYTRRPRTVTCANMVEAAKALEI